MRRELSSIYFRIGSENIDWLDTSPDQRKEILKTKSDTFIRNLILGLSTVYDGMRDSVHLPVMSWDVLPDDRDGLLCELEKVTTLAQELGETYHMSRVGEE